MKAPRFWYQEKSAMASLLSPLSCLFRAGTMLRRKMAHPYRSHKPVICIGNAVVGGAGKTPTALALARILQEQGHRPVFVTRGYGGKTDKRGEAVIVVPHHTVEDVGDEALLLSRTAPTVVGRDRAAAIRLAEKSGTVIIMDDGMQNPHIAATTYILVADGEVGVGNGRILPAGPLREGMADALQRSAMVIMIGADQHNLAAQIELPILRARLEPRLPMGFPRHGPFVAFAGIGRPEKFYATARALGLDLIATIDFPDHHLFSEADIDRLRLAAEEKGARLLTTEKDAVRLPLSFRDEPLTLPVELTFTDSGAENRLLGLLR
jgi:tetraacyldisaccharide 4'-kinase